MRKFSYIVVGTGRCGTVFMSRLLTSLGIPCGHESVFTPEGIDKAANIILGKEDVGLSTVAQKNCIKDEFYNKWWGDLEEIQAESSYMAVPYLNHELLKGAVIIHVVRNPSKVVNSFCNYLGYFTASNPTNEYEAFIYSHIPELRGEFTNYDRACLYYLRWNEMIERQLLNRGYMFHNVENGPQPVMDFLEIQDKEPYNNSKINSFERPSDFFTLNKIQNEDIKNEFIAIGKRYGYTMLSEDLLV